MISRQDAGGLLLSNQNNKLISGVFGMVRHHVVIQHHVADGVRASRLRDDLLTNDLAQ